MCARIIIWVTRVSRGFSLPEPMPSDGRRRRSRAFFASAGPNPGLALAHRLVPHRQRHVALQPLDPSPPRSRPRRCWPPGGPKRPGVGSNTDRSGRGSLSYINSNRKIPARRSQRWPRPVQARITPDCCVSSMGSAFRAIGPLPTRTATVIAK
jgi:hypothetical protein